MNSNSPSNRAADWLESQMDPDGSLRGATSINEYYKAVFALTCDDAAAIFTVAMGLDATDPYSRPFDDLPPAHDWKTDSFTFGVPRVNGVYSAGLHGYYQIVQTRANVLFFSENIHEPRIFPFNGGPHLPENIHTWSGDSRGRWEKDTLIVWDNRFLQHCGIHDYENERRHLVRTTVIGERPI